MTRLKVTLHTIDRARERCPPLAHATDQEVEDAIRTLVATGCPWGRSHRGQRHVFGTIGGVELVVGLAGALDGGAYMVTQTVLTRDQATANALAIAARGGRR